MAGISTQAFNNKRDFATSNLIGGKGLKGKSWPDLDMLSFGWLTDPAEGYANGIRSWIATGRKVHYPLILHVVACACLQGRPMLHFSI
ncbi:hypothetical protein glysoja_004164 [Glycine soja]|nr:hypothetical protein glysoja_004164 [Glycine soja]